MIDIVDLFNACLYIQDHLDADLSLLFLARTVGLSRFRFHRVFKDWRGETLHDFVTRMRMERAAFELSYPIPRSTRRSIKAIAFASGYKSLSSFSHAFSSYASVSPREFRNRALRERRPTLQADDRIAPFGPFRVTVAQQPAREIAVLDPALRDVPCLATLSRLAATAPVSGERYGVELLPNVLARARGEGNLSAKVTRLSCVGVALDDWTRSERARASGRIAPRSVIRLDAGRYAVLEGRGSLAALYRAWRRGFDGWLAATGECPKAGRLYVRFGAGADGAQPDGARSYALFVPLEEATTGGRERPLSVEAAADGCVRPTPMPSAAPNVQGTTPGRAMN